MNPGQGFSDFAADELTGEFHLTREAATAQIGYACTVADRLPRTFAALAAGQIHAVHLRIIEDETRILSDKLAAAADEILGREGPIQRRTGELRYAARRAASSSSSADAARKRKEAARPSSRPRCAGTGNHPGTPG